MKALISPIENKSDGWRIAQVSQEAFDVALPFFWIDCDETITAKDYYYKDGVILEMPVISNEVDVGITSGLTEV
jgi:hypothetical protein